MSLLELFCSIDEFWQQFAPWWQQQLLALGARQHLRPTWLHPSEIMTIASLFQQSHYRTFKAYYTEHVQQHLREEFPQLVSYSRFVELLPTVLAPLIAYLHTQLGACTGISFIDSTSLAVCHNARALLSTASSLVPQHGARPRWAGSTASNSTWSSTTAASS
jgi:hypothetical protein